MDIEQDFKHWLNLKFGHFIPTAVINEIELGFRAGYEYGFVAGYKKADTLQPLVIEPNTSSFPPKSE